MSTVTNNIRNLVFGFFGLFFIFSVGQILYKFIDPKIYLVIASISSLFISNMVLRLMFKPTKVKGLDRTYVLAPDLGIIREENIQAKRVIPEEAVCHFCNRDVYKPFLCVNCKELFCGTHMLPPDHDCPKR